MNRAREGGGIKQPHSGVRFLFCISNFAAYNFKPLAGSIPYFDS